MADTRIPELLALNDVAKTCEAFPPGTSPYPPCERPIRSNRLCDAHNQQRAAGKELRPIRRRRRTMPEFCTGPGVEGLGTPCGLPAIGGGLCNAHYQQDKRRGELVPLFQLRISQDEAYALLQADLKRCPACKNVKPLGEFSRSSAQLSGRSTYCAACQPDYVLMKRFNFPSMEAVREFRESRDYRCDICTRQWQEGQGAFHIDHDSTCCPSRGPSCGKCVRGYLCKLCNTQGLSWYELVGRSMAVVPVFEDYLRRYERRRRDTLPPPA
ncbi:endonuclease domain-containing protein [Streptomyces sp. TLI_185]|uniref:endonuclease domain-containing protein n=1 Tax=Streptomyces sp. TLI_185 TaxID=2485151 RepID=UPI000F4EE5A7|nr:endonuclease domain-containing protein [Streptomyces sp. TLI_185]RPF39350.1 recombination endonuclease VII [Streptomyces sp. TLI_185]